MFFRLSYFASGFFMGCLFALVRFLIIIIKRKLPAKKGREFSTSYTMRTLSAEAEILNRVVPDHATEDEGENDAQ